MKENEFYLLGPIFGPKIEHLGKVFSKNFCLIHFLLTLGKFWFQEKVPTWGVSWAHSKRPKSVGLFNIEGYYTQILHKYAGWGPFWKFWICNSLWKFWNFPHSSRSTDALNKSVPYIWCVLKLGNIFKSLIPKKNIFGRSLCKK